MAKREDKEQVEAPAEAPRPKAADKAEVPPREIEEEHSEEAGRFARFTRRLLERDDGRTMISAMLETSDRAKTEAVRMVAREVRSYLDALELKEDLLDLVRSHSLEINASLRLKPLPPEPEPKGADDDDAR